MRIWTISSYALLAVFAALGTTADQAHGIDPKDLEITINGVRTLELERSELLRIDMTIVNGGDEEASFFSGQFELYDADLKQYGEASAYELQERGEDVPRGVCDTIFGDDVNPGLALDLEVCFEVPRGVQRDALVVYDNAVFKSIKDARIVPLVDDSIAYSAFVEDELPQNEQLATRVDEVESKGGCLIATAAYGSELADEVQNLREIRNRLYESENGGIMRAVNDLYYSFSPTVADWERQNPAFRDLVKIGITPAVASFAIMEHSAMDADGDLVAYVVALTVLNGAMYVGAPAIVIYKAGQHMRGGRPVEPAAPAV